MQEEGDDIGVFFNSSSSQSSSNYEIINYELKYPYSNRIILILFIISKAALIGIFFYCCVNNINPIDYRVKKYEIIKGGVCAIVFMIIFGVLCDYVDLNLIVLFESEILIIQLIFMIYLITKSYLNNRKNLIQDQQQTEELQILV